MHRLRSAVALLSCVPGLLTAQQVWGTAADNYLTRHSEVMTLAPSNQVMKVHHLVLARDAGTLILEDGFLYLLGNVDGHTAGAIFQGTGRFTLIPPNPTERAELHVFANSDTLDDSVSEAVLIFADSTTDQLLHFGSAVGQVPGNVVGHVKDALETLDDAWRWRPVWPFLNGERNGLFVARLKLAKHGDTMFQIDPTETEAVKFYKPAHRTEFGTHWDLVTQFPLAGIPATASRFQWLETTHYVMDANLKETFGADIDLLATTSMTFKADQAAGPWFPFYLQYKILVDSAHWQDGSKAVTFKGKDSGILWVRTPKRLAPGDSLTLTVSYHANHPDLIDRDVEWFYIEPGVAWYPVNLSGSDDATFDVTYHTPHQYSFASVGQRTDSSLSGKVVTTHWTIDRPTPWATFNLGIFENHHVDEPDRALDVMLSEDAHREIAHALATSGYYLPQQSHMVENVTADVSNSLKYYSVLFGPPPSHHFYVTEIPSRKESPSRDSSTSRRAPSTSRLSMGSTNGSGPTRWRTSGGATASSRPRTGTNGWARASRASRHSGTSPRNDTTRPNTSSSWTSTRATSSLTRTPGRSGSEAGRPRSRSPKARRSWSTRRAPGFCTCCGS